MRRFTVYDTLSRETRLFVPLVPPKVGLFVCGLTPYDDAHIGHGRIGVVFDSVARALTRWGYRPFYVQNVTNIDDRLIARGAESGTNPLVLADRHFLAWTLAMRELGVTSVNYYPHATDFIPEIVHQIQSLVERGFAYPASGSVYYEVAKFDRYGRLSGQKVEELRPGSRADVEPGKRAPEDFVLWKAARPGEPSWDSPWGPGRPGWHIEDTAITVRLFGPRYDIHGGGLDLKFPHHEAEIAQAEAATGEAPLVNFWMHAGLVSIAGEKMSKSLGNSVLLQDGIGTFGPMAVRFYYLNAHYRSPLDFVGGKSLEEAKVAYERLAGPFDRISEILARDGLERSGRDLPPDAARAASSCVEKLDEAMATDFNTREAIALLFGWSKAMADWIPHVESLSGSALAALGAPYRWGHEVLGLFRTDDSLPGGELLGRVVAVALEARARARARGDFAEADRIRDALGLAGLAIEDEGDRSRWHARAGNPE
ncbi:MAG: cysteine--tRNA ligase [Thermoplasmata archaeon]|nr:cysteine--tRNA ligase [Thermoplasmata archaeon]